CLAMALEEARGGTTVDLSTLGAGAVRDCPYQDPNHPTWNFKLLRALVDPYGQPVFYFRWATNFPDYQVANLGAHNDPGDPEGLLSDPGWVASQYGQWFKQNCHWVDEGQSMNPSHVIASAGPDGYLGIAAGTESEIGIIPKIAEEFPNPLDISDGKHE